MNTLVNSFRIHAPEWLLAAVAIFAGVAMALYVSSERLALIFIDQNAHLNLSRQVFDSLTPGVSQLGFWPPLLHLLTAPFAAITPLYESGLAAAFVLTPALLGGAILLSLTIREITHSKLFGFIGGLTFILNPYTLYYSVTAMMEVLFLVTTVAVAYFFVRWLKESNLLHLFLAGLFVALSCVARFEGFVLIPTVGILLLGDLISRRYSRHKIEALVLLFGFVALLGLFVIFLYGLVYAGNPLEFATSNWSAGAQQKDFYLPTAGDVSASILYLLTASFYMLSIGSVAAAGFSFIALLVLSRGMSRELAAHASAILLAPFFFIVLTLVRGDVVLYLPDLPPMGSMFNERYGLVLAPFVAFAPGAFLGILSLHIRRLTIPLRISGRAVVGTLASLVLIYNLSFLLHTTAVERFSVLRYSTASYTTERTNQTELAKSLGNSYDWGKVLMTRGLHNYVPTHAGIPLSSYIQEANYPYFDQALYQPWYFARFVVMYNPRFVDEGSWRGANEQVSARWGNSEEFNQYYDLVLENQFGRLYKLNESRAKEKFNEKRLVLVSIPSLNPNLTTWNPETAFAAIGEEFETVTVR